MENNIIGTFDNEYQMRKLFPGKYKIKVKDVFKDYWDNFIVYAEKHKLNIRPIVFKEVKKTLKCNTSLLGYSFFKCNNCGHEHFRYNTCKSRFCNSCGIKYAKQRTLSIMSNLYNCKHRHLVFTIHDSLWNFFREDRKLLNLLFKAVKITLLSWFNKQNKKEQYTPGFILSLHTFGRDNKWHPHIHCLIAEMALGNKNVYKKFDFFPFEMLRKRFQTILLNLMEKELGKVKFRPIKNKVYSLSQNGFYVRAKKDNHNDIKNRIEYILRYCGRPAFASSRIIDVNDGFITFYYQRHEDNKLIVEKISVNDFIMRLIIHISDRGFKSIRRYGFYSKVHKFHDKIKLLIDSVKIPFMASLLKWKMMILSSFNKNPLTCSNCGMEMEFQYIFT